MKLSVPNNSGIKVKANKVLVRPRPVEEVTKSGLVLIQETVDKEQMADMFGVVVGIGSMCWIDEKEPRCEIGDFIIHARYAGEIFQGNDGMKYRLINARDVIATKDPTTTELEALSREFKIDLIKEAA